MAAGILENDNLMYVGDRAWHGLGTRLDNPVNSEEALRIAKLDWSIEQVPIYAGTKQVDGYLGNIRSDTNDCLGIVTQKYRVLQNKDAFAFVDDIMNQDEIECKYESAGSLYNGKRVWMLAKMPDGLILGDKISRYLAITNSHDGKSSVKVCLTDTRICCQNTLNLALETSPRVWSIRHMADIVGRQREAMEILGLSTKYFDESAKKAEQLASTKYEIDTFINLFLPEDDSLSKRQKKNYEIRKEQILNIYNTKNDLQNFKGTAWGIYNAVADVVSNSEPLRSAPTYKENLFVSFLDGNNILERAQAILTA